MRCVQREGLLGIATAAQAWRYLDLDECFMPQNADALGTSAWFEEIVHRWAPVLEAEAGMNYMATLFAVLAVVDV